MAWHRATPTAGAWRRSGSADRGATALVMRRPILAVPSGRTRGLDRLTPKDHSTAGKTGSGRHPALAMRFAAACWWREPPP